MPDVNNYTTDSGTNTGMILAVVLLLILIIGGYFVFARSNPNTMETTQQPATDNSYSANPGTDSGNSGAVNITSVTNSTTTTTQDGSSMGATTTTR